MREELWIVYLKLVRLKIVQRLSSKRVAMARII
jgi:hypothetical protein